MLNTVKFSSAMDLKTKTYTSATLPTTEADAIVLKDIDVNTSTGSAINAPNVTSVGGNTQGTLYINFTKNTLTSCTIKFYGGYEADPDLAGSVGWFLESSETDSSGVLTLNPVSIVLTATGKMMFHFPIGSCRAYKVTVLTTGSIGTDTLSLAVGLRNN